MAPRWQWIDIEDEADWLGEADVEAFPTLGVAAGGPPSEPARAGRQCRALGKNRCAPSIL